MYLTMYGEQPFFSITNPELKRSEWLKVVIDAFEAIAVYLLRLLSGGWLL
jgi:hypothetical protein